MLGTLEGLLNFLKDHSRTFHNSKNLVKESEMGFYHKVTSLMSKNDNCCLRKNLHPLYKCVQFLQLSVQKRIEVVNKNKLCIYCLF